MLSKIAPEQEPMGMSMDMPIDAGGQAFFSRPPREDMEEPPPVEEEAPSFEALFAVLGEEKSAELQAAMEMHPVVAEVGMMAIHTGDGEIAGMETGDTDEVPARVEPGEFIFPKGLVEEIGVENLQALVDEYNQRAAAQAV